MAIEVTIDAAPEGGLKVIPHIPAVRPCRLEGRNGIGKSVAIRLLSLASGRQPYTGDEGAWKSLRSLIGPAQITLKGLAGSAPIAKLQFTPELWPDVPPLEIGDWVGELRLGDVPRPASDLYSLLDVVHIAGTERLIDTVSRRRANFSSALRITSRRLQEIEGQRAQLGGLAEEVAFLTQSREVADTKQRHQCEKELVRAEKDLAALGERSRALQRAALLRALIESGAIEDRQRELEQARTDLKTARAKLKTAEAELAEAVRSLGQGTKVQKAIASQERKLTTLRKRQEAARAARTKVASGHDLPDIAAWDENVLSPEHREELETRYRAASRELAQLERAAYKNVLSVAERQIYEELRVVLDGAISSGHGALVVGRRGDDDLTIEAIAEALKTPPQPAVEAVDDYLARAREVVTALEQLLSIDRDAPALQAEIDGVTAEIARLRAEAPKQDALQEQVNVVRRRRDELSSATQQLALRVGALQASGLLAQDVNAAESELADILKSLKISQDELSSATSSTAGATAHAQQERESLQEQLAELRDADARRRVARRAFATRLQTDNALSWLNRLGGLNGSGVDDGEFFDNLSQRLTRVRIAANYLVRHIEALEDTARSEGQEGPYGDALRTLIEREAREDLGDRAIADALFDGGKIEGLDVKAATVTWKTAQGERRSRPLSAFSSGESVLGFIRARLGQLAPGQSPNRLVFLDEFGAFIAADQRRPLAELLIGPELSDLAAQVIVVLPLQVDYEAELEETTGELHGRYEDRATQVARRGYFTEEFSP